MTRLRTILIAATVAIATPAIAGEVTGTGEETPVAGFVASSICSFSGLNDGNPPPGRVQSYGQLVRMFGIPGVNGFPSPGDACRGNP